MPPAVLANSSEFSRFGGLLAFSKRGKSLILSGLVISTASFNVRALFLVKFSQAGEHAMNTHTSARGDVFASVHHLES